MTKPFRLLLIDDDEVDSKAVIRILRQSPISLDISRSATAAEGLSLAAIEHFDAILLDYRLPDRDGIDVLHSLRSGGVEQGAVIMLSHTEDERITEQCLDAGAQDFLLKDEVNERRLTRAIRQAKQRHVIEETIRINNQQLRILAECDPLTGLANRRGFELTLGPAIARARRSHTGLAVLMLDLDNFKNVNDMLGHDVGDQLLVEIAQRLRSRVRDGDFVCRLGGDEFVVLTCNLEREEQAAFLAERLISTFQKPVRLGNHELKISASIGIAVLDDKADNASRLLRHADVAMYRAKQDGRNQSRFYSDQLHEAMQMMANLRQDIQDAIERNEFTICYQAQVRAEDHQLDSVEALLRWNHPQLGTLCPDDFLSIAEESGDLLKLGIWVLKNACQQFARWQHDLPEVFDTCTLSVNLASAQLRDRSLLHALDMILIDNQLAPECLQLDIAENALIEDPGTAVSMLSSLAARGIKLALDDFGTGYSSLQYIQIFPFRVLKIDNRYIAGIGQGVKNDQMLIAMIRFAQALEMKVVAEGVETPEQAAFCQLHGCNLLQGHHFSRPVLADDFLALWSGKIPPHPQENPQPASSETI